MKESCFLGATIYAANLLVTIVVTKMISMELHTLACCEVDLTQLAILLTLARTAIYGSAIESQDLRSEE